MTSAQVLDLKGNKVREFGLDDEVFGIEPNNGLMHSALVRQLANARRGTANTKTRSEVSGGGKKPWRQKGTGRARAGSIRSPLWEGGGVAFGPKPRDYSISMPRKQRLLALKSALASRRDELVIVDNFDAVKDGKTKEFATVLKALKLDGKKIVLFLDYEHEQHCKVELAARNIDRLKVLHANNLNVKDLLDAEVVLTTQASLETVSNRLKSSHKKGTEGGEPKKAQAKKSEGKKVEKEAKAKPAKEAKEKPAKAAKETKAAPKAKAPKAKSE